MIRTDTSSDLLTISSAVTGFSGGLTKTGAGTLTLSGSNGYTGATRINAGILAVSGGSAIADNQAVILANAAGATLQLNSNETILNVTGGGFSGGNVNVQGNTLTLSSNAGYTFGGQFTGTSSGGVIKTRDRHAHSPATRTLLPDRSRSKAGHWNSPTETTARVRSSRSVPVEPSTWPIPRPCALSRRPTCRQG